MSLGARQVGSVWQPLAPPVEGNRLPCRPPEPRRPQGETQRRRAPAPAGRVTDWPGRAWSSSGGEPGEGPRLPARVLRGPADALAALAGSRLDDGGPQHEQWVLQPGGGPGGLLLHCEDYLLQECAEQASFEGTLHNQYRRLSGRVGENNLVVLEGGKRRSWQTDTSCCYQSGWAVALGTLWPLAAQARGWV